MANSAFRISISITTTTEFRHKMLSRTSLNRMLNKIDSSSVSKDGKIEVIHGLLEQQQTFNVVHVGNFSRNVPMRRGRKSRRRH